MRRVLIPGFDSLGQAAVGDVLQGMVRPTKDEHASREVLDGLVLEGNLRKESERVVETLEREGRHSF